jgi:hypothetical protein
MSTLEARLAALAAAGQTTTYGALAKDLGLRIVELTTMLEALMEVDARDRRPVRAALLNARGNDLPARGFFDKMAELGTDIDDRAAWVADQRLRLASET